MKQIIRLDLPIFRKLFTIPKFLCILCNSIETQLELWRNNSNSCWLYFNGCHDHHNYILALDKFVIWCETLVYLKKIKLSIITKETQPKIIGSYKNSVSEYCIQIKLYLNYPEWLHMNNISEFLFWFNLLQKIVISRR